MNRLLGLTFGAVLWAGSSGAADVIIQRNPFIAGRSDIVDPRSGRTVGIIQDNPFIEGRRDVYGNDGRSRAVVRTNPFIDGRDDIDFTDDD